MEGVRWAIFVARRGLALAAHAPCLNDCMHDPVGAVPIYLLRLFQSRVSSFHRSLKKIPCASCLLQEAPPFTRPSESYLGAHKSSLCLFLPLSPVVSSDPPHFILAKHDAYSQVQPDPILSLKARSCEPWPATRNSAYVHNVVVNAMWSRTQTDRTLVQDKRSSGNYISQRN